MSLIPALGKKRGVDLYEFWAILVYIVSSRTARTTQRDPVSNNNNKSCFANNYAGCFFPVSTVILRNWYYFQSRSLNRKLALMVRLSASESPASNQLRAI